ncbi:MAG TPA: aminotransferase class I/II-fold pyridoxal phosphate-dependent enzyme [Burkholderiaceae bacterium]|nr:aminotransferase class I/II-fold pyridoxal phosphate-dependent enzyme [Burkholderiaceae bacterium]
MTTLDPAELARPAVRGLPAYNAGLSSAAVRRLYGLERVARLGSNENPYGAGAAVRRVLAALADDIWTYPDPSCGALKQAIGARTGIEPGRIIVGNGSENLLELLCLAFLEPGDRVVTQTPSFGLHVIYPQMMGAAVETVALGAGLAYDADAWVAAAASAPKMLILCNPSNPVGCRYGRADFARIVQAAPERTLLVVDEAHHEYALHDPDYPDALQALQGRRGAWIVLRTFSKAWGLAGLRVGYGLASHAAIAALGDRVRTPFNVNQAAQHAALAAWNDARHMRQSVQATVRSRERMAQDLRALGLPGLRIAPSAANFLWLDLGADSAAVHEALPARGFITKAWKDPGFETCLRVSIGLPAQNEAFVGALGEILGAG